MKFNYSKLRGRLAEKGFSQKDLAEAISLSETSLSEKLTNGSGFKAVHIINACEFLDIPSEEVGLYFLPQCSTKANNQVRKEIPMKPINYQPLNEWRLANGLQWQQMAKVARKESPYLSRLRSEGQLLPSDVIRRWKEYYRWTAEETDYFCFNGPKPESRADYIASQLPGFAQKIADLTSEFANLVSQYQKERKYLNEH